MTGRTPTVTACLTEASKPRTIRGPAALPSPDRYTKSPVDDRFRPVRRRMPPFVAAIFGLCLLVLAGGVLYGVGSAIDP